MKLRTLQEIAPPVAFGLLASLMMVALMAVIVDTLGR